MRGGDEFNHTGYILRESINLNGKEEEMDIRAVRGVYGGDFGCNPTLENLARALSWTFDFKYLTARMDAVLGVIIELWLEMPAFINDQWYSPGGYPPRSTLRADTAFCRHDLNLSEYCRRDRLPDCVIDWSRCIIRVIQDDEYFYGPEYEAEDRYWMDMAKDVAGKMTREEFMEAAGRIYDTIKGMEGMVYIPSVEYKVVRGEDGNIVKLLRREAKEDDGK